MNRTKLIASIIALAMVAAIVPGMSQAQTATDLNAQIAALTAQLQALQGQLGTETTTGTATSVAACTGVSFTRNLTIGSTGNDVKCLQALLNQSADTAVAVSGVGSAGFESTTFGGLTKAAVVKFQNKFATEVLAPAGLTSGTGFVGALTRAKLNAMLAGTETVGTTTTTTGTLPAGCTTTAGYSSTTGVKCSTTTTTTTTNTPGAEGTITVTANPTPANSTKVYEGDAKIAIYAMKVKATGSDMDVQRVTLKFGSQPYSYFSKVYLYDGDTMISSADLNSSTVSKVASNDYQITLSGFAAKFIVAKDTYKALTVKVDVLSGISSGVLTDTGTVKNLTILNPTANSVRAVDGSGLNQYSGDTTGRTVIIGQSQATNASMTVSLNANTPKARNLVADSSQAITGATLMTFDVKATKDNLLLDSVSDVLFGLGAHVPTTSSTYSATGGVATGTYIVPTTVYLVDDAGTVIGTATPAVEATVGDLWYASFADLNYTIARDTTKTFSIKVDDTVGAAATATRIGGDDAFKYQVAVFGEKVSATKTNGASLTGSGSANSKDAIVFAEGPVFTLASISTTSTQAAFDGASSTISATFNIQVAATTGDVWIPSTSAFTVNYVTGETNAAVSNITYVQPSGTTAGTNGYKISAGNPATFAVTGTKAANAGTYDLRINAINWAHTDAAALALPISSTYMAGDSTWISQAIYLQ